MAMEKLILKSVMYGVDKIPDSWFDKVPGGFYKSSQKGGEKGANDEKVDGSSSGKKQRRYSHHGDDRRRARRDRFEEESRANDAKRQQRRERSSYDGSHDYDYDQEYRRQARDGGRRRRHHSADNDRYGYNDGYSQSINDYYGDRKQHASRQQRPRDPFFDDKQRPVTSDGGRGVNSSSLKAAAAAEASAPYPSNLAAPTHAATMPAPQVTPTTPLSSSRPVSSATAARYVPYSHIYGQATGGQHPPFAPPPHVGPGVTPMRTASPQTYQPTAAAQQAAATTGTKAGAQYTGQPFAAAPTASASARGPAAGYESQPPYPHSPRTGRSADRYSPSHASHEKQQGPDLRRSRSERRPNGSDKKGRHYGNAPYVDPQAPLHGQMDVSKDSRRDSAHERDDRHGRSQRTNDRGYTSD